MWYISDSKISLLQGRNNMKIEFKVGDNVVHLSHGVGVIRSIEEKTFALGKQHFYLVEIDDNKAPKKVSEILREGDVAEVKVEKIDRKDSLVIATLEQEPELQGALLSYDLTSGEVLAMVGGRDFAKSKFNRALQAKRQVGSTFKPIIYAAAMDRGFSPSSIVTDSPLIFKHEEQLDADNQGEDWRPRNYSGKFEGDIPLRLALIRSMNIPTVKLLNEITIDYGIQYARSLGITAPLPRDLSIGLGSWSSSLEEIMRAYAVFPRLGKPVQLHYIKKVVNGKGEVLEDLAATVAKEEKHMRKFME
jgi:penicillin-binding protein 1A